MMDKPKNFCEYKCSECLNGKGLDFSFTMAFQPIVDVEKKTVCAQEALVRGLNNEPASWVFSHVNDQNRYAFDQACRVKAVKLAAQLKLSSLLSINFLPNAVYRPELCIRTTLSAAEKYGFPFTRIMFEVTESEKVDNVEHLRSIFSHYRERGFLTALDDFGAGYSGLSMLADLDVSVLKLDMHLAQNVDKSPRKQAIIRGIMTTCRELGIDVIAEGIEREEEFATLHGIGITLFQGFYFAKPAFETIADINWP